MLNNLTTNVLKYHKNHVLAGGPGGGLKRGSGGGLFWTLFWTLFFHFFMKFLYFFIKILKNEKNPKKVLGPRGHF